MVVGEEKLRDTHGVMATESNINRKFRSGLRFQMIGFRSHFLNLQGWSLASGWFNVISRTLVERSLVLLQRCNR